MHAGLGAQEAVRVFTRHLDGRAFQAGNLALGFLEQLGGEALAFAVAQVLAQQHRRPVLRFGAAGARLDLQEAVVGVGRVGEHAPELEVGDFAIDLLRVGFDGFEGGVVFLAARHLEEFVGVVDAAADVDQTQHHAVECLLFLAEILGALGVAPDVGCFELAVDFLEPDLLHIEVKDTPVDRRRARAVLRSGLRSGSVVLLPSSFSARVNPTV